MDHLLKHMIDMPFEGEIMRRQEGSGGLFGYWLERAVDVQSRLPDALFSGPGLPVAYKPEDSPDDSTQPAVKKKEINRRGMPTNYDKNVVSHANVGDENKFFNLRPSRQLNKIRHKYADDDDEPIPRKRKRRQDFDPHSMKHRVKNHDNPYLRQNNIANEKSLHSDAAARQNSTVLLSRLKQFQDEGAAQLSQISTSITTFQEAFLDLAHTMKDMRHEMKECNNILRQIAAGPNRKASENLNTDGNVEVQVDA